MADTRRTNQNQPGQGGYDDLTVRQGQYVYGQNGQRQPGQRQPNPSQNGYQGQGGYDDRTVRQGQYAYGQNGQRRPDPGNQSQRQPGQGYQGQQQSGQRYPGQQQPAQGYQGQAPRQGRPYQNSGATYQDGQYGRTINEGAYRDTRYTNQGGGMPPKKRGNPAATVLLSVLMVALLAAVLVAAIGMKAGLVVTVPLGVLAVAVLMAIIGVNGGSFVTMLLSAALVAAIGVFGFSGYKLYSIFLSDGSNSYKVGEKEYGGLANHYFDESTASSQEEDDGSANEADSLKQPYIATTAELEVPENIEGIIEGTQTEEVQENGTYKELPRLHNPVDFEGLEAINKDIIGWIKISALDLSYPVAQGEDNDYYLHRTFRKEDNFAGCIFLNCSNTRYLTDQNSIIYGHNMKNGSMFGTLSKYQQQSTFDAGQYFWVFTKEFIYQYHIFSSHVVSSIGDDYRTRFTTKEFDDYIAKCQADSYIKTNVDVPQGSRIMTLSTCTGDDSTRFIVQGVLTQVYVSA